MSVTALMPPASSGLLLRANFFLFCVAARTISLPRGLQLEGFVRTEIQEQIFAAFQCGTPFSVAARVHPYLELSDAGREADLMSRQQAFLHLQLDADCMCLEVRLRPQNLPGCLWEITGPVIRPPCPEILGSEFCRAFFEQCLGV